VQTANKFGFTPQHHVFLFVYDSINKIIVKQNFLAFSITIQMFCYSYGAYNAIIVNVEVIPLVMRNFSIS
jgi:hypothetical protein